MRLLRAGEEMDEAARLDLAQQIFDLETSADTVRNGIHEQLSQKVLLAVGRSELYGLVEAQDSIADYAEDIAAILTYRRLQWPVVLRDDFENFLRLIRRNCQLAEGLFSRLDLLVESSFRGRDALTATKIIAELQEREDETKEQKIRLIRRLFSADTGLSDLDLMLWKQVVENAAELSKSAEKTGNALRLILETKS